MADNSPVYQFSLVKQLILSADKHEQYIISVYIIMHSI